MTATPTTKSTRRASRGSLASPRLAFFCAILGIGGAGRAAASPVNGPVREAELLPRSVYVPVRFEVAPCLDEVIIWTEDGSVRGAAPGRLVSQFTFYPGRQGAAPEWERLRLEGWVERSGDPGERERFRTGIVITPANLYVGDRRIALGLEQRLSRFRRKADVRLEERTLRLRPPGGCGEEAPNK